MAILFFFSLPPILADVHAEDSPRWWVGYKKARQSHGRSPVSSPAADQTHHQTSSSSKSTHLINMANIPKGKTFRLFILMRVFSTCPALLKCFVLCVQLSCDLQLLRYLRLLLSMPGWWALGLPPAPTRRTQRPRLILRPVTHRRLCKKLLKCIFVKPV